MTVSRGIAKAPSVDSKMLENNIAYVHVPMLSSGKAAEARKNIDDLLKKGATSVILDLRASAGGDETEGIALASVFMDSGTIGYAVGQKSEKRTLTIDPRAALTKAPLAVLVNEGTSGPPSWSPERYETTSEARSSAGRRLETDPYRSSFRWMTAPPADCRRQVLHSTGKDIEEVGIEPQVKITAQEEEQST
jgi:carboxyl-terminal processing protease